MKRGNFCARFIGRRFWICCLFGCLFLLPAKGIGQQSEEDHLKIIQAQKGDTIEVLSLNELYKIYHKRDPEKALGYLEDALELATKLDYQRGLGYVWRSFGSYFNSRGEHEKAEKVFQRGIEVFQGINDEEGVIACRNGLGNLAIRQGNYSLALEHYFAEARYAEERGDMRGAAVAYQNIGGVHYRQGQFDQALEYIEKSLKIKEARKDSAGMVPTLNALSVVYSARQDYEGALKIQYRTLGIARRHSNLFEISSILNNMGVQYHFLNQLDSARHYYLQSLELDRKLNEKQELSNLYINLGELECLQGNGKQAIVYYDSSLAISEASGGMEYVAHSYRGLANAYEILGDHKQAYDWLTKYHGLRDSLTGERVKMQINDLEAKYQAEQKDREIAELKQNEAEVASANDRRNTILTIVISGGILIVLGLLFLIGRNRAREKQHRAELEQKALRSQMNPHFIFNSLGAIQSMYMSGETDLANNYLGNFGKLMRKILDYSGKESISIKEELAMLRLYLDLEKERNSGLIDYEFVVDERIDQLGTQIPPMVVQPFVENAIWHGVLPSKRKGKISIQMELGVDDGAIWCAVEDNGVGLGKGKAKSQHVSRGIDITQQRLGHKVKFTALSPGTRVSIRIPI